MSLESAAAPEIQARAKEMGWIGPENFKGDPEKFVDADQFIERGETVLPIVKATLAKERNEFAEFRRQAELTATALTQLQEKQKESDIRFAAEKQRAVDDAIKATKADLARATAAGDHDAAAELTDDLVSLNVDKTAAAADVAAAKAKPVEKQKPAIDDVAAEDLRAVQDWIADGNEWFNTDRRRVALMNGIAAELREKGNIQSRKAFLNTCKAEMLKTLGETETLVNKVEGGARNGDGTESRSDGKKGYNSLPTAAKEQCAADAKQFVGPTKRFKTLPEWNARFAEIYFEKE